MRDHRGERLSTSLRVAILAAMVAVGSFTEGCNCRGTDGNASENQPGPGRLSFSLANYTVSAYAGAVTITVNRVGGSAGAVSVQYSTSDGTATVADADYTAIAATTLNWADGDSTPQTFQVLFPGSDDTVQEPSETFNLNLTNPTGGATTGAPATVTLVESFTKFPGNPVLTANTGTWDTLDVEGPCVVKTGAMSYTMIYEGGDPTTDYIGRATSTDGVAWTRDATPILSPTGAATFDGAALWRPWAILDGTTWHMWYTGAVSNGAGGVDMKIGYATTTDLTAATGWTRQNGGNPVLSPGAAATFDESNVGWACVIKDGATFKMWYTAFSTTAVSIGYTTSADGITWGARTQVLTITGGAAFESAAVFQPGVIKDGAVYRMWYTGQNAAGNWQIGYARSADGTTWTRYAGNPVIPIGGTGSSWDTADTYYPGPMRDGDVFKVWYTGDTDPVDPATWQIGLTTNP